MSPLLESEADILQPVRMLMGCKFYACGTVEEGLGLGLGAECSRRPNCPIFWCIITLHSGDGMITLTFTEPHGIIQHHFCSMID